jgi:hypothetical protein
MAEDEANELDEFVRGNFCGFKNCKDACSAVDVTGIVDAVLVE